MNGRNPQFFFPPLQWLAFALALATFSFSAKAGNFSTVIIDAGHGGHDLGANQSLVYEKHLNLDVARRLERSLKQLGIKTVMIRTSDRFVPLNTRAAIANRHRNAVYVSVHFNSSYKNKVTGIETFYKSSAGRSLATYVQRELIGTLRAKDRGVKTANFAVLKKTRHPAVLVEGGFISNKQERSVMMDPRYRQGVVDSIVRGLMKYKNAR
ncbi:N-acetylmuramoyl-L-alanine amidase [Verrucomicrobiales bacterium]|nr:N-acetylmuramoyl-L-alanine amidase [Verrucomicrobiales bacterium]